MGLGLHGFIILHFITAIDLIVYNYLYSSLLSFTDKCKLFLLLRALQFRVKQLQGAANSTAPNTITFLLSFITLLLVLLLKLILLLRQLLPLLIQVLILRLPLLLQTLFNLYMISIYSNTPNYSTKDYFSTSTCHLFKYYYR